MKISAIFISAVLAFVLFSGCINFGGNENAIAEVTPDNASVEEVKAPEPSLQWSVNECREFGNAKVCLEDISADTNENSKHYAMVAITMGGSSGTEDKIAPGASKVLNGITVSVSETNPGSSVSSPNAKMRLSGSYSSSRDARALRKDSCINYSSSKICLSDISRETFESSPSPAMVSIIGADNTRVNELKISANSHEVVKIDGSNVAIYVGDTAAGISTSKSWARITVNDTAESPAESTFTTIYKGSCKIGYGMKVCLSDLRIDNSSKTIAVFDILDSSDVLLSKKYLGEGSSDSSILSGRRFKIDTGEIGYGYSSGTGWAKGSILILTD
jgi:hypothetical protein